MSVRSVPIERAVLVVGHPGHELRVHGWLERARPVVMVLTDGSGSHGVPRIGSTAALLARAGATPGPIFGRLTDADVYRALLEGDVRLFVALVEELASAMAMRHAAVVAGDDAEGYNPTHDVCRLLVNAAVDLARQEHGLAVENLAFALMEHPAGAANPEPLGRSEYHLDDAALGRKIAAAVAYPEMAAEVARARARFGDDAFRTEAFRHVGPGDRWNPGAEPPYYERYGAERVQAGAYAKVIRYDAHIVPLADALAARIPQRQ